MREIPQLRKKDGTALVLGGGAVKGFFYYLGVLKALDEAGEQFTSVVGTSAGAIAGALLASGISVNTLASAKPYKKIYIPELDRWIKPPTSYALFKPIYQDYLRQLLIVALESVRFISLLPWLWGRDLVNEALDKLIHSQTEITAWFSPEALDQFFLDLLPSQAFSEQAVDLYVSATFLDNPHLRVVFNGVYDFAEHENVFMTNVPINQAILASSAIPGVFEPVKIDESFFVDGEIKQTLSADIGIRLADRVIIAHAYQPLLLGEGRSVRDIGWLNIVRQSFYTVFRERITTWRYIYEQQNPGKQIIWIEPDPTDEEFFQAPEFSFRPEVQRLLIAKGAEAAHKALDKETTRAK